MEAIVSDFGFARNVQEDSGKTNSVVGPLRWMSPVRIFSEISYQKRKVFQIRHIRNKVMFGLLALLVKKLPSIPVNFFSVGSVDERADAIWRDAAISSGYWCF